MEKENELKPPEKVLSNILFEYIPFLSVLNLNVQVQLNESQTEETTAIFYVFLRQDYYIVHILSICKDVYRAP